MPSNQTIPGLSSIASPSSAGLLWVSDPSANPQDRSLTLANLFAMLGLTPIITSGALGTLTTLGGTYLLSAATTVTLPASPRLHATFTFKNRGAFTTTISANAGQTIGSTTSASFSLYATEDYVTLRWDGAAIWEVVATNGPVLTSLQTGANNFPTTGAWTAIANGLVLASLAPGVYDLELSCVLGVGATNIAVCIGNGTTPISEILGSTASTTTVKITLRNYVLGAAATIQGLYYAVASVGNINFGSTWAVGRITARRVA